ncbi:MAG: hypothetical protein LUP95_00740 [Euryarchaeota archaeon]|nr:hypothetical protein [Euryarchaeota archaeon]
MNQKVALLTHKVRHRARQIEQEIDQNIWDLNVEKLTEDEFKATLIVREPMLSIDAGDVVSYTGVPRNFTIRSPSLEYLLDAIEQILTEQIDEIIESQGA